MSQPRQPGIPHPRLPLCSRARSISEHQSDTDSQRDDGHSCSTADGAGQRVGAGLFGSLGRQFSGRRICDNRFTR